MGELANYSIETDHMVLLAFKDGRRLRVPMGQLAAHLAPPDLAKVHSAIKLRREFIQQHMPKALIVLIAAGLLAMLLAGGRSVAQLWHKPKALPPAPSATHIVRSIDLPTSSTSPTPQASPPGPVPVKAAVAPVGAKARPTARRTIATAAVKQSNTSLTTPLVTISLPLSLPVTLPAASPAPTPTPTPSESPIASGSSSGLPANPIPNQGQVLGDSTGPSDKPAQ